MFKQRIFYSMAYMLPIVRHDFPALDKLLWDTHAEQLTPERAFFTYEKRWAYIDPAELTEKEKNLIDTLIDVIGHGVFMPAKY